MSDARREARRGLVWTGGAQLLTRAIDVVSTILVIRHLTGVDLGVASIAGAVGAVVEALACFGVPTAIIQSKELDDDHASTLFWFCTACGALGAGLLALLSPWLAAAYDRPELTAMVAVFGLKILPLWAGIVPQQLMLRALHFHRTSVTQVLPVLLEAVVKIAGVLAGLGAWALVLAHVMRGVSFFVVAFLVSGFRPRFHYRTSELVPYLRFGAWAFVATFATEAYKNLDYFLIGRYFGMGVLGSYRIAFDLAMSPADSVAQPIYRVTYPLLVKLGDSREKMRSIFYEASADMINLVLPVTLIVLFCADDVLAAIASDRWERALPAIPWLCAAAVLRTVTRLFNSLFFAANLPRFAIGDAVGTLAVLLVLMPTLIVLLGDGLAEISVCIAWVVAYPIVFAGLFLLARAAVGLRLGDYMRHVLPGLKAGAVLAPLLVGATWLTDRTIEDPRLRVALVAVPAGLLCAWLIKRFKRDLKAQAAA